MAQVSSNTTLATLLHHADSLSTAFNSHHASSLNSVQSVVSSYNQLANLLSLPSTPATRSRPGGGIKERGMAKVQETIEEGLSGVRDDLGKMERDVESLNSLLFQADVFLAEPGTALQHGLNPREALTHVSNLFSSYQAELIRLREVLADFTTETIGPDAFADEWRVMKEVDKGSQDELSELADMMGSWGGASGGLDVEMS
ncbi:hypothetical protein RQP46_009644 [Phenoliferia psychrophenolica]